jgi:hypothetical protein
MPEGTRADIASTSSLFLGIETRTFIAVIAGTTLCWFALRDPRLRRAPRLLSAGITLGLLIIAGWIVTTCVVDDFASPTKPQSLTFVSTVGKALYAGLQNVTNFADFGVGSVFGVVAGSWFAAWRSAELRWKPSTTITRCGVIWAAARSWEWWHSCRRLHHWSGTDGGIDARAFRSTRHRLHGDRRTSWHRHSGRWLAARHYSAPVGELVGKSDPAE